MKRSKAKLEGILQPRKQRRAVQTGAGKTHTHTQSVTETEREGKREIRKARREELKIRCFLSRQKTTKKEHPKTKKCDFILVF